MFHVPRRAYAGLLLLTVSSSVFATTLLTKTVIPGFVRPEFAVYKNCTVDDQGILTVQNRINGLYSKINESVQLSVGSLRAFVDGAAKGTIKQPVTQIADVPSTLYYAYRKVSGGGLKKILLEIDNGSTDTSTYNESSEAKTLRNFIDTVCK